HLGARAVIAAGMGIKDQVREAIQLLSSKQMVERTVHIHTGWRKLDGGWAYLHGGGALGATGAVNGVETALRAGARRRAQRRHSRRSRNSGLALKPARTQPWAGEVGAPGGARRLAGWRFFICMPTCWSGPSREKPAQSAHRRAQ